MLLCSGFGSQTKGPGAKGDATTGRTAFDSPTGTLDSPGSSTTTSPAGAAHSISCSAASPNLLMISAQCGRLVT